MPQLPQALQYTYTGLKATCDNPYMIIIALAALIVISLISGLIAARRSLTKPDRIVKGHNDYRTGRKEWMDN